MRPTLRATIEHLTNQISHSLETAAAAAVSTALIASHCLALPPMPSIQFMIGKLDWYFRLAALDSHLIVVVVVVVFVPFQVSIPQ
jgi:hypothetical protein